MLKPITAGWGTALKSRLALAGNPLRLFAADLADGWPEDRNRHARQGMSPGNIDAELATGMPVVVSPKYRAEHEALPDHQLALSGAEVDDGRSFKNVQVRAVPLAAVK